MDREVNQYGIDSWKWYCHTDPGRSGDGFRLDDEELAYPFYEQSKKLGLTTFSVHKDLLRNLAHLGISRILAISRKRPPTILI